MYKIMLVEDDTKLTYLLEEHLRKWNFEVAVPVDFSKIVAEFVQVKPDLLIIDINLPFYDGFYWCQEIRKLSKVPILILSSRDSDMDKILGLNTGADDYMEKPFSLELLLTKVQALLRRSYAYLDQSLNILEYQSMILNLETGKVTYHDQEITLTPNEHKILALLIKYSEKIVSRETIMESLWEDESFIDDNTLTVNMNRLRKKLEAIDQVKIETIKSRGYRLCKQENI